MRNQPSGTQPEEPMEQSLAAGLSDDLIDEPAGPQRFVVPEDLAGSRVDAGLATLMGSSRAQVAALIAEGNVTCNGRAVSKSLETGRRLRPRRRRP